MPSLIGVHGLLNEADTLIAQVDRKLSQARRELAELRQTDRVGELRDISDDVGRARVRLATYRNGIRQLIEDMR